MDGERKADVGTAENETAHPADLHLRHLVRDPGKRGAGYVHDHGLRKVSVIRSSPMMRTSGTPRLRGRYDNGLVCTLHKM
jgi:hypothetical protein